eukprot:3693905-Rhodomonas_salina.1
MCIRDRSTWCQHTLSQYCTEIVAAYASLVSAVGKVSQHMLAQYRATSPRQYRGWRSNMRNIARVSTGHRVAAYAGRRITSA